MDRVILHCDCNNFYASVERIFHPELEGVPMAVCGSPDSRHGIILAKNELAKKMGVQTAETLWQARRKCPDLVLVPPHHERYAHYSRLAGEIFGRYTDQVEPFGIDESWLDVTGSRRLFGDGETIANRIRGDMKRELGLTVSVGVSFNKVFAKLGSDYKKPDAVTVISRENYREIVHPLPVTDLLYVGRATAERLRQLGIRTIGDLAEFDRGALEKLLGKAGTTLYCYANGLDEEPVLRESQREEIKSVGNGMTFPRNLETMEDVKSGLLFLSETVAARLRRYDLKCAGVQLAIRDPDFKTIDRQCQLPAPTHVTREIYAAALELFSRSWRAGSPVRMLTVTGIRLTGQDAGVQTDLFGTEKKRDKLEALDHSLDSIREKYGKSAVKPAAILKNDLGLDDD
ncbi:MAG: DNA polymerase IV [Oscillospiraceae bacterium]|nr:DNA polymerase IV [Oscillospiraceae bacterium]